MSSPPVFNIHLRLAFKTLFNLFLQNYYSPPVSLALYQMISVFLNYYQLHMKFLIDTHPPIWGVLSLIFLKHLIKFGMKARCWG